MKSNELRIGNYISDVHASDKSYFEVLKLGYTKCWYGMPKYCINYNDLKPIPLTEEWLLKFGFKEDNNCWDLNINGYVFYLEELGNNDNEDIDFYFTSSFNMTKLKHVHQLQNLYFALTSEELTLK